MPKPTFYQLLSGGMTSEEHRKKSMLSSAKKRADAKLTSKPKLDIHAGLDLLGMTPGAGAIPDLVNAALYASKGDKSKSLSSLASAVPFAGQAATLKRMTEIGKTIYEEGDE